MSYPITGVKTGFGPGTAVPVRQEIDSWAQNNPDQVNLYLQALAQLQSTNQDDRLSYFSLAGIHGEPFRPWDEKTNPNQNSNWQGYCTHASVLFPTWHRPYLALLEQVLHDIMNNLVQQFSDPALRQRYQYAADRFRLPYWDSAQLKTRNGQKSLNVPFLVTQPQVEVLTPTGTRTIANPLYQYKFHPNATNISGFQGQNGQIFPFDAVLGTSRQPPPYDPRNRSNVQAWNQGIVNNDEIVKELQNLSSFGQDVYNALQLKRFVWFATKAQTSQPTPAGYQSIEAIHDTIHGLVGGSGHMGFPAVSAFDPIFWLHHTNIDRLFAIWQATHPDDRRAQDGTEPWFTNPSQQVREEDGTWALPVNNLDTPTTPLAPFHKDTVGTTFDSNAVRDWTRLGYSYPELQPWLPQYMINGQWSEAAYIRDINLQLNSLYARLRTRLGSPVSRPVDRSMLSRLFSGSRAASSQPAMAAQSFPQPGVQSVQSRGIEETAPTQDHGFGQGQTGAKQPSTIDNLTSQAKNVFQSVQKSAQQVLGGDGAHNHGEHMPQPGRPHHQEGFVASAMSTAQNVMQSVQQSAQQALAAEKAAGQGPNQQAQGHGQGGHRTGLLASAQSTMHAVKHKAQEVIAAGGVQQTSGSVPGQQSQSSNQASGNMPVNTNEQTAPYVLPGQAGAYNQAMDTNTAQATTAMSNLGLNPADNDVKFHDYSVNIRFERNCLPTAFTVHVFLGDFSPNPLDWPTDANRVGSVYNFYSGIHRAGGAANCGNCEQQADQNVIVTGQVSLTNSLLDDMEDQNVPLDTIHPEEVERWLMRHLHWRISDANGVEVPRDRMPSLKVSVVECVATIPSDPSHMMTYSDHRIMDAVTDGRPCGKRPADGI